MSKLVLFDASSLIKHFARISSGLRRTIESSLNDVAKLAQKHAKATKKFKGTVLKDNIKIIKNGSFATEVLADKDYAYYLEFGNNQKGAFIYPRQAKALHFYVNGTEVFAKRVRSHPGYYFMKAAAEHASGQASKIFTQRIQKLIDKG